MNISINEINFLSHLIFNRKLNHVQVQDWAFKQYEYGNVPKWVEDLSIAYSIEEMTDIIRYEFNLSGELSQNEKIGEVAFLFFNYKITIEEAVRKLYYAICLPNNGHKYAPDIYYIDDLYDWHDHPEGKAEKVLVPILQEYLESYAKPYKNFST